MVASEHHLVLRNAAVWVLVLLFGYITTVVGKFVFHLEIVFSQQLKEVHSFGFF